MWLTPQILTPELIERMRNLIAAGRYTVIHFNESGLHAWAPGRVADGQYGPLMLQYVHAMKSASHGATLIWASTTPVTVLGAPGQLDPVDQLISDRNAICARIMQQEDIEEDDLHALLLPHLDQAKGDRFHWNDEAYELLADTVARSIANHLPVAAGR